MNDSQGRIRLERRDGAATIWIDNPARRNALGREMIGELVSVLARLDADPEVGCIVVRGARGTFCSGLDLTGLHRDAHRDADARPSRDGEQSMVALAGHLDEAFAGLQTLSIAVVEGHAVGAGCQVALGCTLRLAAPDAGFAIPVGRLGLVYPPTSIRRLVGLVGDARATAMLATGRRIDARTACVWGLVTALVGDGSSLDADIDSFIADIGAGSRLSLAASLEMVRAASGDPRATGQGLEALHRHWSALSEATGEHREALAARAEGRRPEFGWRPAS